MTGARSTIIYAPFTIRAAPVRYSAFPTEMRIAKHGGLSMRLSWLMGIWLSPASCWAGPLDWPLIRAAYFGDLPAVERQLAAGTDLEQTDERGRTALMWAAYKG